jgi:3-deoxy-D-manno-octulosonic-acid transferase
MQLGIRISAVWNPKAAQWITGRKNWKTQINALPKKQTVRIWFHVSSLGEFEQARPVIEELKKSKPETDIILTFFSPSGYAIRKNYALAKVYYLPIDLPGNATFWIKQVNPDLAVFVKYDLWPGYLLALIKHKIPFLLISAHFRPGTLSSWSIPPTNYLLKKANAIFLQNEEWKDQLQRKGFHNIHVAGDTRIDRTLSLAKETRDGLPRQLHDLGPFDLVAGSTWKEDEELLIPVIEQLNLKVILAPHDVSETNVSRIMQNIPLPAIRISKITEANDKTRIIVVDNIGMLAYLYSLGKIAYIGGGFGKGIHNTLEPAAHHLPIIFGPKYSAFPEAIDMIRSGAAISIQDQIELKNAIGHFIKDNQYFGNLAFSYLEKRKGATQIISAYIRESIPFDREI